MEKFNIGDIIRRKSNASWSRQSTCRVTGYCDDRYVKIEDIITGERIGVGGGWDHKNFELVSQDFQVGDTVKINENVTIGELAADNWRGCQRTTLKFLEQAHMNRVFTIKYVHKNTIIVEGHPEIIAKAVVLVSRKPEATEMTVEEINKALGYDVKIVKG